MLSTRYTIGAHTFVRPSHTPGTILYGKWLQLQVYYLTYFHRYLYLDLAIVYTVD
jgi:hypothetical protein